MGLAMFGAVLAKCTTVTYCRHRLLPLVPEGRALVTGARVRLEKRTGSGFGPAKAFIRELPPPHALFWSCTGFKYTSTKLMRSMQRTASGAKKVIYQATLDRTLRTISLAYSSLTKEPALLIMIHTRENIILSTRLFSGEFGRWRITE